MEITQLCIPSDLPFFNGSNGAGAGNGVGTGNGVGNRPTGGFGGGSGIGKKNHILRLKRVNYRKHSLI